MSFGSKFDFEGYVWLWKKLTRHYDMLQSQDNTHINVCSIVEESSKTKEELDIDAQLQRLQVSWFK